MNELIVALCLGVILGLMACMWLVRKERAKLTENCYRYDMAKTYYGKQWMNAISECDQSHMHGDCVLCGKDE